jgi:hypothetical protein
LQLLATQLLNIVPIDVPDLIQLCTEPLDIEQHCHESFAVSDRLEKIDKLIGTHGVEGIFEWRTGGTVDALNYREEDVIDIQYCNTGDTYGSTILYWKGKFRIGDWGHIAERLSKVKQNQNS